MEPSELRNVADSIREKDPAGAVCMYRDAADSGDAKAASSLGYMLMVGEGIDADLQDAERYLRIAVDAGDDKALCNLGALVMERDAEEALKLFERAAEAGSIVGMRNAASLLRGGISPADPARAALWLERAAEAGDIQSAAVLAHMLRTGEGIDVDKRRAAELYRIAADAGDPDSQYDLAMMLDSGDGVPADRAEAERLFRLSADQGDNDARLCLGGILYERGQIAEAADIFADAALDGDVKAMYNLALIYLEGSMGGTDRSKGMEWLETASESGFAYAQTMLGTLLLEDGDLAGAERWLRAAADQSEPTAMYNLGALALSGKIVMDDREAIRLVVGAADSGMPEAQEILSRLSEQGMLRGASSLPIPAVVLSVCIPSQGCHGEHGVQCLRESVGVEVYLPSVHGHARLQTFGEGPALLRQGIERHPSAAGPAPLIEKPLSDEHPEPLVDDPPRCKVYEAARGALAVLQRVSQYAVDVWAIEYAAGRVCHARMIIAVLQFRFLSNSHELDMKSGDMTRCTNENATRSERAFFRDPV